MTTYKCPKCESTNLVARIDGRLRINNQKFYPAEHTAVADVTAWQHVDCLECDESFEGHELDVTEGLKYTLEQLADVLRKHPRIEEKTVVVGSSGGNCQEVMAEACWADISAKHHRAELHFSFHSAGKILEDGEDSITAYVDAPVDGRAPDVSDYDDSFYHEPKSFPGITQTTQEMTDTINELVDELLTAYEKGQDQ